MDANVNFCLLGRVVLWEPECSENLKMNLTLSQNIFLMSLNILFIIKTISNKLAHFTFKITSLANVHTAIFKTGNPTRTYCMPQGTLFNIMYM